MRTPAALSLCTLALAFGGCATTVNVDSLTLAPRVERGVLSKGIEEAYSLSDPFDNKRYGNVFRMGNGRMVAIFLLPQSENGVYAGDRLGIADVVGNPLYIERSIDNPDSEVNIEDASGRIWWYELRLGKKGDETFIVLTDAKGVSAAVPVNALFRWRIQGATDKVMLGDKPYRTACAGGAKGGILFFSEATTRAALDPETGRADLLPTYFAITTERVNGADRYIDNVLLGQSGYRLTLKGGVYQVELAR